MIQHIPQRSLTGLQSEIQWRLQCSVSTENIRALQSIPTMNLPRTLNLYFQDTIEYIEDTSDYLKDYIDKCFSIRGALALKWLFNQYIPEIWSEEQDKYNENKPRCLWTQTALKKRRRNDVLRKSEAPIMNSSGQTGIME